MDTQREKELVDLLDKYDLADTPFAVAKEEILAKGFTEAELVYGLYSAPFDGKANGHPRPANPLQKFYEENPDKADEVAKRLLFVQAETDWGKTAAYSGAAEMGPDTQVRSYYTVLLAERLGIPYISLMLFSVVLLIVAIKLSLSKEATDFIFLVFNVFVSGWFLCKLYLERRRVTKLRKELKIIDKK